MSIARRFLARCVVQDLALYGRESVVDVSAPSEVFLVLEQNIDEARELLQQRHGDAGVTDLDSELITLPFLCRRDWLVDRAEVALAFAEWHRDLLIIDYAAAPPDEFSRAREVVRAAFRARALPAVWQAYDACIDALDAEARPPPEIGFNQSPGFPLL